MQVPSRIFWIFRCRVVHGRRQGVRQIVMIAIDRGMRLSNGDNLLGMMGGSGVGSGGDWG